MDLSTMTWVVDRVRNAVDFTDLGPAGPSTANIAGYAQMADDARAVILWLHEHEALTQHADPVGVNTCAAQGYPGS